MKAQWQRASVGFVSVVVLGVALGGCDVTAYCFSGCDETGGGGGATTAATGGASQGGDGGGIIFEQGGGKVDCGDTQSSLENCGACGAKCAPAGAIAVCVEGQCLVQACLEGQYDIDGQPDNGCEYACPITAPDVELCDGVDNDCDALVDAADPDLLAPTTLCKSDPGTPCEQVALQCNGLDGWECVYPPEVESVLGFVRDVETLCDGLDGNCDGDVDEWFTTLGDVCDDGANGPCRDFGLVVCDPMNPTKTACDYNAPPDPGVAMAEACDGVDNDCNGFVDDALPLVAFELAAIPGSLAKVDTYEASRPDATAMNAGLDEGVSCSKAGVLPWTGGNHQEAAAACAARGPGFRLCTLAELEDACRGANDTLYPYGATYAPMTCNGADKGLGKAAATGSLAQCQSSGDPVYDASGNVAEWTQTQTNMAMAPGRIFALAGGSYLSPSLGRACTIELAPRALETTLLPNVGFRCCYDP